MSFQSQIKKFNDKTKLKAVRIFRGTALSIFGRVIIRTPVLSGRARGNWQTQLNRAPNSVLDVKDKNGAAAITQAGKAVSRAKLGDTLFLINNLPYIEPLENGSSEQAPTGMVKVSIAEFQARVKENVRRNR